MVRSDVRLLVHNKRYEQIPKMDFDYAVGNNRFMGSYVAVFGP